MTRILTAIAILFFCTSADADQHWFEALKDSGDDRALYRVLHAMPKGGDLHNHNTGSVLPKDWLRIALAQQERGYRYYTKTRINNCRDYSEANTVYLLLFRNISQLDYDALSQCEQSEHTALDELSEAERLGWINSLKLDNPTEGREEFFRNHWQRINALAANPYLRAEILFQNMKDLGDDNAIYLETQAAVHGAMRPDGSAFEPEEVADIYRERLKQRDAAETGVTVRLQLMVLRFAPNAEDRLRELYTFALENRDLYVALNMAGREDDDKGHPRRFLETYREMRHLGALPLSIHAGEVDEPNDHVRDTLLLGASRIGHGLNLITDDELMIDMRYGPYLVEINLISNLLLEYVVDYSQHPFPEFLRTGIPVALSTDDRGMWDSTLTDEFFVGVKEYDLTWEEIKLMGRNSIQFSFVEDPVKERLLERFNQKMKAFERRMERRGLANDDEFPDTRTFICARYKICD
ncbi:MAG: adenosine deaminase [Pseudomonadota bacterium]